jgi:hypothetical protein
MATTNELSFNIKVGGNQDQALGSLKTQLREATAEVTKLSEQFGASSNEAVQAAKRASELKDQIGDAKSLIDAFNPDAKFKALTASLSGVAGGFAAAQGAIALFGVESEAVEKTLLKVQSAMAISEGLQNVGESIDSFKQLGTVIKNTSVFQAAYNFVMGEKVAIQEADVATTVAATVATKAKAAATNTATAATTASSAAMKIFRGALLATGIGALVIGIIALVQNFDKLKNAVLNAVPSLGRLASFIGNTINAFTDLIGVTNAATRAEQQRQAIYNKAAAGTKIVNEGIDRQIKLLQAQGAEQGKIDALKKQSIQNELNDLKKAANERGILFGEQAKKYKDLQNDLKVIDATAQKAREDEAKKAAEKRTTAGNKYAEDAKKKAEQEAKERLDAEKVALEKLSELRTQIFLSTFKNENDRKRAELNIAFDKEKEEILANTKITESTKNQLIIEARNKLNTDLDAIKKAEKEKKAAEDAKLLEETAAQVTIENEDEYAAVQKKIAENKKLNEKLKADNDAAREAEKQADIALQDAKFQTASAGLNLLSSLAGENEKIANAIFVIDKALAIAKIVVDTQREIAGYAANPLWSALPDGGAVIKAKYILGAKIRAGIGIASIAGASISKFKNGGSAGVSSGGSQSGASAPSVSAAAPLQPPQPQTTTLSTQSINALGNQAQRAYVVESDVTSSQQRMAAIQQRARFG